MDKTTDKTDSIRGESFVETVSFILLLAEKGTWVGFTAGILLLNWNKIPRTKLSVISEHLRKVR